MNFFLSVVALFFFASADAQYSFKAIIKHDGEPLPGASVTIKELGRTEVADSSGYVNFSGISSNTYTIEVTHIGFQKFTKQIKISNHQEIPVDLILEESHEEEEEEIIIHSTRTSRTIENIPTRVETIAGEEVDEKSNMRPSNVTMLLNESTGIRVQQTSATSGNASIRIQGLDGRYTQLLKDGFPNYSGFSGGLSVLEIPPLDLQQVEIIKGPASTLYGGGAIAGVINFISIEPGDENYGKFLLNVSHIGQTNVGAFITQRSGKWGFTMMATANRQQAYDVDNDHFTEIPKTKDYTIIPRVFIYPDEKTKFSIGHSLTTGKRIGGDIQVVNAFPDATHTYFENNETVRNLTTLQFERNISDRKSINVKQSLGFFDRRIKIPGYSFKGSQLNAYTDASFLWREKKHILIVGANFIYDRFNEDQEAVIKRNEKNITAGVYIQDTWDAASRLSFENGFRVDVTDKHGIFLLPRFSILYRINSKTTTRIGAGLGYKLPTLFTEETESLHFENVQPLDNSLKAEKSYGGTADINWRTKIGGEFDISLNHMFFYTAIRKPLVLQNVSPEFRFMNASSNTISYGFETNLKLIFHHDWKLFTGFTWNEIEANWKTGNTFLPLVPKHKLNLAFIYEKHDFLKAGFEAYRTGEQFLSNGQKTSPFWIMGFMVEKPLKKFSFYINFENFTDERQSKHKRVVNGPHDDPSFDEIWNHTEGFVVNGGIKIRIADK